MFWNGASYQISIKETSTQEVRLMIFAGLIKRNFLQLTLSFQAGDHSCLGVVVCTDPPGVQIIRACLNRFPLGTYFQARSLSRSDRWTPLSTSCLTWPGSQWENFHRQLAPILNELNDTLLSQRRQLIFTDKSKIQIWLLCVIWEPRIYMDFTPDKTRTGLLFFQQI